MKPDLITKLQPLYHDSYHTFVPDRNGKRVRCFFRSQQQDAQVEESFSFFEKLLVREERQKNGRVCERVQGGLQSVMVTWAGEQYAED